MPAVLTFTNPIEQPDLVDAVVESPITIVNGTISMFLAWRDGDGNLLKSTAVEFTLTQQQREAQAQQLIAIAVSQGAIPAATISFEPDPTPPQQGNQEP